MQTLGTTTITNAKFWTHFGWNFLASVHFKWINHSIKLLVSAIGKRAMFGNVLLSRVKPPVRSFPVMVYRYPVTGIGFMFRV